MKSLRTIKQIITGMMLLVFTIGITPKKYFHDFFSRHTDYLYGSDHNSKEKEIVTYKFNCGFNEIIGTDAFIESKAVQFRHIIAYPAFASYQIPERLHYTAFECFVHRGPPLS